jgi:hypothetical protein
LISIYAQHTVAEVKAQPDLLENAFGKSLKDLALLPSFPADQEFVEKLKLPIDQQQIFQTADRKAQIGQCLKWLLRTVMFDKAPPSTVALEMDTLKDLFLKMYGEGNWSAPQREHFDFVFERLKEWNSYFLSYTNEGAKIVNERYKNAIQLYTPPDILNKRDREKDNLLADAIVNSLRRRLLSRRGFYDKEKIALGGDITAAIEPAAGKTFAFIQLVQLETFDISKPENWSYKEYQLFQAHSDKELMGRNQYREVYGMRFAPILAGKEKDLYLKDLMPWDYELWIGHIFTRTHFVELPVEAEAFDNAMNELRETIVHLMYQIIDNVP